MVDAMKGIAQLGVGLTVEERNLLSVAYKNVIGGRRASWRIISNLEAKANKANNKEDEELAKEYRLKIEKELQETSADILDLLDKDLIPTAPPPEEKDNSQDTSEAYVFYQKMKGDYLRYLAEFSTGNDKKEAAENSLVAYKNASVVAKGHLRPTHAIRLGLALNFSVFYYEILNSPERACRLAKNAFDDAVTELDGLPDENYKDSTLIMQLLRDNLTLWTSDVDNEDADGEKGESEIQDMDNDETKNAT